MKNEERTLFVLKYGHPQATKEWLHSLPDEVFFKLVGSEQREYYLKDKPFLIDEILREYELRVIFSNGTYHIDSEHKIFSRYIFDCYFKHFYSNE